MILLLIRVLLFQRILKNLLLRNYHIGFLKIVSRGLTFASIVEKILKEGYKKSYMASVTNTLKARKCLN